MTTGAVPITQVGHKWEDNIYKNMTHMSVYPTHAKGPGYFLSQIYCLEEPVQIEGHKQKVASPRDLPSEDVSVGFWLFSKKYEAIPLPVCLKDCDCGKTRDWIVDHYVAATEMRMGEKRRSQKPAQQNIASTIYQ